MDAKASTELLSKLTGIKLSGKTRTETDLIGEREIPDELYFGVQTLRGIENFQISGKTLRDFPYLVQGLAYVKKAAALANTELNLMSKEICEAICKSCDEIIDGEFHEQFIVDLIQGGAGTSTNMCANEVIANRALEHLGKPKGDYKTVSPNDHINLAQSTNDAYPTSLHIAFLFYNKDVIAALEKLVDAFRKKSKEFDRVIKMGRTQLQDAVPMTLGQEFGAFANTLEAEIENLDCAISWLTDVNMGATAIGTGLNCHHKYPEICVRELAKLTGLDLELSKDLIAATPDTTGFVSYSSAVKRLAIKLSKICNDLRLLSSGPRAGFGEINLPPMQPGSSIMPGKVNPVIPEVVNQVCFKVFGNDYTITFAAEAAQLQLNVMEPVIVEALFESMNYMISAMDTLRVLCVEGITANSERCREMVLQNIGIVTALNPVIGYKTSTAIAKEALETGRGIYELVLEKKILDKETLDKLLEPESMCNFNIG
jgi:aspartate ammonia-lyase